MKKKLTRIWGVGLVVVMISTLLLSAAPMSASELGWGTESIPSGTNQIIVNGVKIFDVAVAGDGTTIYAATNLANVYKSTDGGKTWSIKTHSGLTPLTNVTRVAVAPDDPDLVMAANATTVSVSTNGGSTWTSLGTVQEAGGPTAVTAINDIAISADDSGNHYLAVAGDETGTLANTWYYKLGSTGAAWKELNTKNGFGGTGTGTAAPYDQALALEFSPNFASDKMLLVVTANITTGADKIALEVYSFNYDTWNQDAALTSYPATVVSNTVGVMTAAQATIAVSPDYLGSDDAERLAFVGVDATATTDDDIDGIYRLTDTSVKEVSLTKDVGSTTGYVAWSTDGNSNWSKSTKQINDSGNPVQVTASGLANGDFIYAGTEAADLDIDRWEIGSSTSWKDIMSGTQGDGMLAYSWTATAHSTPYPTIPATARYVERFLRPPLTTRQPGARWQAPARPSPRYHQL